MLEQEKKNLEKLRENESQNCNEIARAEANIRTLQEQLRQSTNDVSINWVALMFWWFMVNGGICCARSFNSVD